MPPKRKPQQKEVKGGEKVASEEALDSAENNGVAVLQKNQDNENPVTEIVQKAQKKNAARGQKPLPDPAKEESVDEPPATVETDIEKNGGVEKLVEETVTKPGRKPAAKKPKKPVNGHNDGEEVADAAIKTDVEPTEKAENVAPRRGGRRGANQKVDDVPPSKDIDDEKEQTVADGVNQKVEKDNKAEEPTKKNDKQPSRRGAKHLPIVEDAPSNGVSDEVLSSEGISEVPKAPPRRGGKRGQKAEEGTDAASAADEAAAPNGEAETVTETQSAGDSKDVKKAVSRRGGKRGQKAEEDTDAASAADEAAAPNGQAETVTETQSAGDSKDVKKAVSRRGGKRGQKAEEDTDAASAADEAAAPNGQAETVTETQAAGDSKDVKKAVSRKGGKRGQKAEEAQPSSELADTEPAAVDENMEVENELDVDLKDKDYSRPRRGFKRRVDEADANPVTAEPSKPRKGGGRDAQAAKPEVDADTAENESNEPVQEAKGAAKKRGGKAKEDKNGKTAEAEPEEKKLKVEDETNYDCDKKNKKGEKWNLKISTWNVAGLRALIKKNGMQYVKDEDADIICFQETKCPESKVPAEAKVEGYHTFWASGEKDGYAGVALYTKEEPLNVTYGINNKEHDEEGRVITAEYEKFYLVTTYVPNAGQGLKTLPKRMNWDKIFRDYLKELDAKKPVILCGDLNVAHEEIDLANPKTNTKSAGFTKEERENMTELLKQGFVDSFRQLYPDKTGCYTFWTYFRNARANNTGWRLDYFVVSERLMDSVCDVAIRNKVLGSDHCPTTLFIHI